MTTNLHLRTARLILRPLEVEDAEALWPYVSDPALSRLMVWEAHTSRNQTEAFLTAVVEARKLGTDLAWAILHNDAIVGKIGLHDITRSFRAWTVNRADLGYWIAPPHQRQGFATEATQAVVRYGFEELKLHKLTVGCLEENVGSRAVIEKVGFERIGVQRAHVYRFGRWWDHLAYEMLASDWQTRRAAHPSASETNPA